MQAVVTPKRIMAMAVVDVSRNQPHFVRFFPSNIFLRRIPGPGIPRPEERLYVNHPSHSFFI